MGNLREPARTRLSELEMLRTAAFAAVVLQHVIGAYVRREGLSRAEGAALGLLFGLCKFAVPAFVFLSGAVLFLRYYGRLDYAPFLKKRLRSILVPYLLWAALYYVHGWIVGGAPLCGGREYLLRILTCSVSYHTWYVLLILQFYLLLPVIFALYGWLERRCRGRASFWALAAAVAGISLLLVSGAAVFRPVPVLGKLLYDWRAENCLYYLGYFLLGGLCGVRMERFRRFVCRWTPALAVAAAAGYAWAEWRLFRDGFSGGVPDLNWMGSLSVRMLLFSAASVLLLYRVCCGLSGYRRLGRLCAFVGRHSYSAYLAHAMVLTTGSMALLDVAPHLRYPAFYLLLTALTLGGSVCAGWVSDRVCAVFCRKKPAVVKA